MKETAKKKGFLSELLDQDTLIHKLLTYGAHWRCWWYALWSPGA